MKDYRNPYVFDIQFVLEQVKGKDWEKKLKFSGEIDLGTIEGPFTLENADLDFEKMKEIVYPKVIREIEYALSLQRHYM
jgi:hypothetical protein